MKCLRQWPTSDKARLHGHLYNTFTEQWLLKFNVMTKGDHVNGFPKSLHVVISGLKMCSEDERANWCKEKGGL